MFPNLKLDRWILPISIAAITIARINPTTAPAVAQQVQCDSFTPLPAGKSASEAPSDVQTAAQRAANAVTEPNARLGRFNIHTNNGIAVYEFVGRQANGCLIEVDAIRLNRIEEIEKELPSLAQVPVAVHTRLDRELPDFQITLIEQSTRPQPRPRPVPPLEPSRVFYEIRGTCASANRPYCQAGQAGRAVVRSDGSTFDFFELTNY
jgi:hypothetical protein